MKSSKQVGKTLTIEECEDIDYLYRHGEEASAEGEHEKALRYLNRVLKLDPKHALAWNVKGNSLDETGKFEDALKSYDAAIKLDPDNGDFLFDKAETLEKMGRNEEAKKLMEIAAEMESGA